MRIIIIAVLLISLVGCYNPTVTSFKVAPHNSRVVSAGITGMTNIIDDNDKEESTYNSTSADIFFPDNLGFRKTKGVSIGLRKGLRNYRHVGGDLHLIHFGKDENNDRDYFRFAANATFQKQLNPYTGFSPNIGLMIMNNPSKFDWSIDESQYFFAFLGTFGFSFGCKFFAGIPINDDFFGFAAEINWMSAAPDKLFSTYFYLFFDKQIVNNTLNISVGIDPRSLTATARVNYMYTFSKRD